MRKKLADFSEADCLLLIGNPILIGVAVALASDASECGHVNMLQWNGRESRYTRIESVIFPPTGEGRNGE
jgi:hypothetical protein